LAAGTYTATVRVSASNATDASTIAVSLVVQDPNAPPALQLSATSAAFTTTLGLSPSSQAIQVLNAGGSSLSGVAFSVSYGSGATGWLSTSALGATTAPTTLTLRPVTTGLAAGTYTATVQVSGTGVTTKSIAVTLTVVASGLAVTIASYPALANVGGVAGSVGTVNGGQVAVARISATAFAAYSMRCPHAGTTINVVNGTSFRCPNHGALFTSTGALASNSPFRTSNLNALTVSYAPGATVLYVS
jgi:Rieske Fe-S protein